MKNNYLKEKVLPHLSFATIYLIILFVYFSATLGGKVLTSNDIVQSIGTLKESQIYHNKGEEILWTNTSFSGMPIWRGFSANLIGKFHYFITDVVPVPVLLCFLSFIGFYILLSVYRLSPWVCFLGSAAYSLSTFNFVSIEAGHINKVFDMALMAPVLAGIILLYNKRYWSGAGITTLFVGLHVYYGHIQISYYLLILILFFVAAELYKAIKIKKLKDFIISSMIAVLCAVIGIAPNISKLWVMAEYSKSTTRGGSELSTKQHEGGGLDKDYALSWSNGKLETMTLLIPGFYGGSSNEELNQNSETYKMLLQNGVSKKEAKDYIKSMPLYWGTQPFTSGPVYFGAIVCFLFITGLFVIKGPLKWWILSASLLSILLSWGKNFEFLTDIFFYYFPLYNKFRSVTMILSIAELTFPLLGCIGLYKILKDDEDIDFKLKSVKWSVIISGGICLLFALLGGSIFDFGSDSDKQMPAWLVESLQSDRASKLRMDSIRSLILILLAATTIWLYLKATIKLMHVYLAMSFLIIFDLWAIDKKYLNNDNLKYKQKDIERQVLSQSDADRQILQDTDPNYRVFNLTTNPFSDAITSHHHKSIGGYSAIKLGRYQELIENHLSKNNIQVMNMLNTKYFIVQDEKSKEVQVQQNYQALGNAWFVKNFKIVKNADEELKTLEKFDPRMEAVVDKRYLNELNGLNQDNTINGSIKLTDYHPNHLTYETNADREGLAVFSEIYYEPGWNAYVDDKITPHIRVNYVLRGLRIPAGKHKIQFRFEPKTYFIAETISLISSIIFILFVGGVFVMCVVKIRNENNHYENAPNTYV